MEVEITTVDRVPWSGRIQVRERLIPALSVPWNLPRVAALPNMPFSGVLRSLENVTFQLQNLHVEQGRSSAQHCS
jgi:hypothetical protein